MSAAGGTITLLLGVALLRLTLGGTYTRYVQEGMAPWLVAAAVAVIALGLATLVRAWRRPAAGAGPAENEHGEHGHHDHGGGVGWLLLGPIVVLLLVAPPALGSYGVDRGAAVDVRSGVSAFEPLPADAAPVPMTLLEFSQRAFDRDGASFNGATVELTGFVAGGEGFRLARYQIACCAADAAPLVVRIVGARGGPPPRDRWVTVTGRFHGTAGDTAELAALTVREIPTPADPYE